MDEPELTELITTTDFARAVVAIQKRAERQSNPEKLAEVFVQTDLPLRCETTDHQLFLGRRGTGKTHLLKYFQYTKHLQGGVVWFADCTALGSGFPSSSEDPVAVASKYFSALLNEIATFLWDEAIRLEMPNAESQNRVLSTLSEGLVRFIDRETDEGSSIFNYRQITESLQKVITGLQLPHLTLILDEWANVPRQAQPYLAEFLKRAVLTVPRVSLKILAVSYQCQFSATVGGEIIGLQRGADFTDVVDIDRYLVYDDRAEFVMEFFGQLLYNHLGAELGWDLTLDADRKVATVRQLFTQEAAFVELVRAAEGNCRDFICIFSKAYLEGFRQRGGAKSISIPHVCDASSSWYANEKEANIRAEEEVGRTMSYLLNNVLKGYKSRTFLVEATKAEHPRLIRLLNERILHRLTEVYSHPDNPGLRYEIFTLDHGAYVRFRGTVNEPKQNVFLFAEDVSALPADEREYTVPIDDKRSIRRIVFDPECLEVRT